VFLVSKGRGKGVKRRRKGKDPVTYVNTPSPSEKRGGGEEKEEGGGKAPVCSQIICDASLHLRRRGRGEKWEKKKKVGRRSGKKCEERREGI